MVAEDTVLMEELSWTEIADRVADGYDTTILACGAVEQHGPHLPTGVDTYLGYSLAEATARELGETLVAPTLRPGCSDHHINFPGTISISRDTFVSLLEEYCESLANTGFDNIVLIPSHGGNIDIMRTYSPKIARKLQDEASVYFVRPDYSELLEYWEEIDVDRVEAGVHAGYGETARMLADYAELVDMDKAEEGMTIEEFYDDDRVAQSQLESFIYGIDAQVPNGILGDPRGATAEHGKEIKDIMAGDLAARIRDRIDSDFLSMDLPDSVAHEYE